METSVRSGKISIVLPAYNEAAMLPKTVRVLSELLASEGMDYELVFVNDGSKDSTWSEIEKAAAENDRVTGVKFSRNFGKEAAVFAGLATASGDCVVVMDCDLQHPPEAVIRMYRLWQQGYEVVEGVKHSRGKESALHRASAGMFYKMMSSATKIDMQRASDFKLLDRRAVQAVLELPEKNMFFRAISSWVGFDSTVIEFDVQEREAGESKWSTKSLIRYALINVTGFTTMPLQIVTVAGVIMFLIGLIFGVQTLVHYFSGNSVEGFTTVILLQLIIGSLIMLSLGVIGYYMARIYEEVKNRPRYIISEVRRGKKED